MCFVIMREFSHLEFLSVSLRDLDNIDTLMADITEQQELAREISDAISQPFGEEFDEVTSSWATAGLCFLKALCRSDLLF